jgi:hypothetical protein
MIKVIQTKEMVFMKKTGTALDLCSEHQLERIKETVVRFIHKYGGTGHKVQAMSLHVSCILNIGEVPVMAEKFPETFLYEPHESGDRYKHMISLK